MKRETLEEFFESMKTVKTYGWDALVVYDRNRANQLLLQEYISRFDEGRYFPPLTLVTDTTPGVRWEVTYDYILDKPRLSFENSDVTNSRADLKMKIVGGKQVTVMRQPGSKYYQVSRLKHADALNGAVLHARVSLDVAPGSVGEAGRTVLDLSRKDLKFYLTIGDSEEENEAGGLRFKREFDEWPDEDKVFPLNTLVVNEQDFLQPEAFFIRTHAAPDSRILNAPGHGDGEIILFVRMRGSSNGDFPPTNEDLHYLLPTSPAGPCTVNIIIGRNLLFFKLMESALARVSDLEAPQLVALEGAATGARLVKGTKRLKGVELGDHNAVKNLVLQTDLVLAGRSDGQRDAVFQFKAAGELEGLEMTVAGSQVFDVAFDLAGAPRTASIEFEWDLVFEANPRYRLSEDGRYQLVFVSRLKPLSLRNTVLTEGFESGVINNLLTKTYSYFAGIFSEIAEQIAPEADAINALQLHRILFGNASSWILPTAPKVPADLIQPGFLAPTRTDYHITDTELVIGAGRQHTFSLSGDVQARWSVRNLPGEDGYPGCIDPETGVYTAPEAADLPLKHKRVIVTATTKLHVSTALVSVVTRSIGFDPVVMAVANGQSSNKITASALGNATITWSMAPGSKGQLIDDPQGTPDAQYAKLYISPARRNSISDVGQGRNVAPAARKSEAWLTRSNTGAEQQDDEIEKVLWVDTIVGTLDDGTSETLNVLVPMEVVTHWFTFEPQGDGIQLKFWGRNKSGDYEVDSEKTKWYQVLGSGSFDNGLYTPSSTGAGDYAVVAAIEINDDWKWAYAIMPLPYLRVDELIEHSQEVAP